MEHVDPIRNTEDIEAMKQILRSNSQRDLLFFVFGINTGIRANELLSLRIDQVWDGEKVREFLYLGDAQGGDPKGYYINDSIKRELIAYLSEADVKASHEYLFKSKKDELPITRQQAYRIINQAAAEAGIPGNIGTNTMRKTFGYHAYRKGIAISILSKIFNHQSSSETLKFIGVDKNDTSFVKVDVNL